LIGCDLTQLDDFTRALLTNPEVLEVSQDSLGDQAVEIARDGDARVYAEKLADGTKAVGLFNTGTNGTITVTVKWSDLKVSGNENVRDLWRQKDLGKFKGEFSLPVGPHNAEMVKIGSK